MAININISSIFKTTEKTETLYYEGDTVIYFHPVRGEYVTGVIQFIDWKSERSYGDGIDRAYVVGIGDFDFADYVEAGDLRPAGTFSDTMEVA